MVWKFKFSKQLLVATGLIGLSFVVLTGCGGGKSLSSPQIYGNNPSSQPADSLKSSEKDDAAVSTSSEKGKESLLGTLMEDDAEAAAGSTKGVTPKSSPQAMTEHSARQSNDAESKPQDDLTEFFSNFAPNTDDSAAAVDDDLWRQFDLAEEYHAMGVLANREASWEEAQYYFEKALRIMANLDVETDSTLTPEAERYTSILDNLIADYRLALLSLGELTEDVSSAILVEKFGDLASRLGSDSIYIAANEEHVVAYDIPIVMNERVKSSIVYFQTVARDAFARYLGRSKKYAGLMKTVLREHGLPEDLVYLSLVESGYNPHAYSWARAMGLWQFIASTGRLYKLERSWWLDERKDPIKSTYAAARFLKDLYKQFGSWELAMAAYNGGPGRVSRTIKQQKTDDFWKMRLKRQTMDYVPLIMAATIIAKNPEKYGFYNIDYEPELVWDEVVIDKCLELTAVADAIGCTIENLKDLNPELLRKYTPPNTSNYVLKIPKGSKESFWSAYEELPSPKETSWARHEIRRGETVSTIAAKYGVSQYAILEANNLSNRSHIYAGKTLIVPVPLDREYRESPSRQNSDYSAKNSIYVVRSGDTMWDIAKAFGTTVEGLRRANYIEKGSRIYVGQKLKIPSNARNFKDKNNDGNEKVYASQESSPASGNSKATTSTRTYRVRSGDNLWDIARKFGTTTGRIRHLNDLHGNSRIYPGQELKIDDASVFDSEGYVLHAVKRGETLAKIAQKYRTSIAKIVSSNNIDDPDLLEVGAELRIYVD